jgi:uncharacterized membrane protein
VVAVVARSPLLRLLVSILAGVIAGLVVEDGALAVLIGLAVAGVVFVVFGWLVLWPMTVADTKSNAHREVFRAALEETVIVAVALAALVCIVALLVRTGGHADPVSAVVALVGVFAAWAGLHLMYAARYAFYYYDETDHRKPGGIDFNQDGYQPVFRDFFYFSYNLGMTYQVSDTSVSDPRIRAVTLRHCLLSYLFGTGILATAINLVLGMVTG